MLVNEVLVRKVRVLGNVLGLGPREDYSLQEIQAEVRHTQNTDFRGSAHISLPESFQQRPYDGIFRHATLLERRLPFSHSFRSHEATARSGQGPARASALV